MAAVAVVNRGGDKKEQQEHKKQNSNSRSWIDYFISIHKQNGASAIKILSFRRFRVSSPQGECRGGNVISIIGVVNVFLLLYYNRERTTTVIW